MIPLRDDIRSRTRPWVTYGLVAACTLVFFYQLFSELTDPRLDNVITFTWGMVPAEVVRGQRLWTLITSMFLHGGFFHIIGNMLYLWIFGDNVEDALGRGWYILVYLGAGLFGSLLHLVMSGGLVHAPPPVGVAEMLEVAARNPGALGELLFRYPLLRPMIGASGAISGVMGVYFVLFPRARVLTLVPILFFIRIIYLPAFVLLGFWILLQLFYGCSAAPGTGGVAYFAHIGGFVVGILVGLLARRRRRSQGIWYDIS
ncbi:rhomboid family intramembrane serine protease [candidate division WOR-3 bacterium]|nr:rhomboid family intramembrane serine protease [candidate division WOR-3 bacterium]